MLVAISSPGTVADMPRFVMRYFERDSSAVSLEVGSEAEAQGRP